MRLRRVMGLVAVVACLPLAAYAQTDFYAERLQRGIVDYNRGQYVHAATELRVAAFGAVDSIPQYEIANIYLTLADEKLGRTADAASAADKVVRAERITPAYSALTLDGQVRTAFQDALPKLLTKEQLARATTFAPFASASVVQTPLTPIVRSEPKVVVSVAATDAQRAAAAVRAGDLAGARELATKAIGEDFTNSLAHAVLGYLAWTEKNWNGVVEHYAIVRTRRRLTNEENAAFYVAMIRTGRMADAAGVRRVLPPAVLLMPIVETATPGAAMATHFEQPRMASAPPPQPAPQPAASQPQTRVTVAAPTQTAPPRTVEPLVATGAAPDQQRVAREIIEADRLLRAGRVSEARQGYERLAAEPLSREMTLEVARGLHQTSAFRASSEEYRKAYPLRRGSEERHMFNEAVNRYEMGEYAMAKKILAAALPGLPSSREVELYRYRIEHAK